VVVEVTMSLLLLLLMNLSWKQERERGRTQGLQINNTSDDLLAGALAW
jgi:hypothetical protein